MDARSRWCALSLTRLGSIAPPQLGGTVWTEDKGNSPAAPYLRAVMGVSLRPNYPRPSAKSAVQFRSESDRTTRKVVPPFEVEGPLSALRSLRLNSEAGWRPTPILRWITTCFATRTDYSAHGMINKKADLRKTADRRCSTKPLNRGCDFALYQSPLSGGR